MHKERLTELPANAVSAFFHQPIFNFDEVCYSHGHPLGSDFDLSRGRGGLDSLIGLYLKNSTPNAQDEITEEQIDKFHSDLVDNAPYSSIGILTTPLRSSSSVSAFDLAVQLQRKVIAMHLLKEKMEVDRQRHSPPAVSQEIYLTILTRVLDPLPIYNLDGSDFINLTKATSHVFSDDDGKDTVERARKILAYWLENESKINPRSTDYLLLNPINQARECVKALREKLIEDAVDGLGLMERSETTDTMYSILLSKIPEIENTGIIIKILKLYDRYHNFYNQNRGSGQNGEYRFDPRSFEELFSILERDDRNNVFSAVAEVLSNITGPIFVMRGRHNSLENYNMYPQNVDEYRQAVFNCSNRMLDILFASLVNHPDSNNDTRNTVLIAFYKSAIGLNLIGELTRSAFYGDKENFQYGYQLIALRSRISQLKGAVQNAEKSFAPTDPAHNNRNLIMIYGLISMLLERDL